MLGELASTAAERIKRGSEKVATNAQLLATMATLYMEDVNAEARARVDATDRSSGAPSVVQKGADAKLAVEGALTTVQQALQEEAEQGFPTVQKGLSVLKDVSKQLPPLPPVQIPPALTDAAKALAKPGPEDPPLPTAGGRALAAGTSASAAPAAGHEDDAIEKVDSNPEEVSSNPEPELSGDKEDLVAQPTAGSETPREEPADGAKVEAASQEEVVTGMMPEAGAGEEADVEAGVAGEAADVFFESAAERIAQLKEEGAAAIARRDKIACDMQRRGHSSTNFDEEDSVDDEADIIGVVTPLEQQPSEAIVQYSGSTEGGSSIAGEPTKGRPPIPEAPAPPRKTRKRKGKKNSKR